MDVVVVGSILGAPLFGISVVLALGVLAFVARNSFHIGRARRKEQLARERQRREFWGFE